MSYWKASNQKDCTYHANYNSCDFRRIVHNGYLLCLVLSRIFRCATIELIAIRVLPLLRIITETSRNYNANRSRNTFFWCHYRKFPFCGIPESESMRIVTRKITFYSSHCVLVGKHHFQICIRGAPCSAYCYGSSLLIFRPKIRDFVVISTIGNGERINVYSSLLGWLLSYIGYRKLLDFRAVNFLHLKFCAFFRHCRKCTQEHHHKCKEK